LRSGVLITGSSRRPGMHLRDRAFARHERRARCGGDALVPSGLLHPRAGEVLEKSCAQDLAAGLLDTSIELFIGRWPT
jgi:hypothetical protein